MTFDGEGIIQTGVLKSLLENLNKLGPEAKSIQIDRQMMRVILTELIQAIEIRDKKDIERFFYIQRNTLQFAAAEIAEMIKRCLADFATSGLSTDQILQELLSSVQNLKDFAAEGQSDTIQ